MEYILGLVLTLQVGRLETRRGILVFSVLHEVMVCRAGHSMGIHPGDGGDHRGLAAARQPPHHHHGQGGGEKADGVRVS